MPQHEPLHLPVTQLTGIGSQSAQRLEKLGIHTIRDLLFHLPLRYQDKSRIQTISQLVAGSSALVCGTVEYTEYPQPGRSTITCRISDHSGTLSLRFFHFSIRQIQPLKPGTKLGCFGEIRHGFNGLEMVHPEYRVIETPEQLLESSLIPVYPTVEGLSQRTLRKAVQQALTLCQQCDSLQDWLPPQLCKAHQFPSLREALQLLHQPPAELTPLLVNGHDFPARKRLAFEEFLAHHLALLQGKQAYKHWQAPVLRLNPTSKQRFIDCLPFKLTGAQQRVIAEIEQDCSQPKPMLRLIQGDVGSGKTVVAALTALAALDNGYQVALMAPTELLAEQHFANFQNWFANLDQLPCFLSGAVKGKQRQTTLNAIASGEAAIIIGTHALFQDSVQFHKLGLVIIDEQHRFGVHQRQALRAKGQYQNIRPHQLVMTATPIPRTLAMLSYADLDISVIDELPPGRQAITTRVISNQRREEIVQRIHDWIAQGRQVYWVCPLIEESEQLQCEAAEKTALLLSQLLPDVRIGLLHGRLKATDKDQVMQSFKNRACDLLVATTVIEVGVDVPNASLMIIENAERLGLSQLHQLRGRVGRGSIDSYCLLLYQPPLSETGKQRLAIIKQYQDGFIIAERDLALRGPGEVMGTRQTGQIQFRIADLERDNDLLDEIPAAAAWIKQHSPAAITALIQRWVGLQRHQYHDIA